MSRSLQPRKIARRALVPFLMLCFLLQAMPVSAQFGRDSLPSSFAGLAERVSSTVVNISTTQMVEGRRMYPFMGPDSGLEEFFRDFFGDMPQQQFERSALGSGFIIDNSGLILTNSHVVAKAEEIKVTLAGGEIVYDAKVIGTDPQTDIALIKVEPDKFFPKPAPLGNSDAAEVGDWVMAIGNPFGLGHTVTTGIVSAKGRVIGAGPYDNFLQTDAAINPGNSGGPLFNMQGEVVGISTAIVAQAQGIGFAIPINLAKTLLPQLKQGKVVRGWLGVGIQEITPELAEFFNLEVRQGVLISDIFENSPAAKAGLQRGDVIVSFNGERVQNPNELSRMVAATQPGTEVELQVIRDGQRRTLEMELGTKPQPGAERDMMQRDEETALGISVRNLTPQLAQRFGFDPQESGVIISEVEPGSPAANVGLRPGLLIKEINNQPVQNVEDYQRLVAQGKEKGRYLLLVQQRDRSFYVVLEAG